MPCTCLSSLRGVKMMESEGKMTTTDARGWINALIKAMHEETSGTWPDPEYKDEVYSALEMAIKALENHDTFMKYAYSQGKQDALSQEPCTDAVSREAVYHILDEVGGEFDKPREAVVPVDYIADMVGELPSVNPQYTGNEFFNFDAPIVKKSMEQDVISRNDMMDAIGHGTTYTSEELQKIITNLPPVTQKSGKCKNCKYFEYDSVAKVDGVPLIVAHEICNKWGNGCKTSEDGYCFMFEPQESEE